MGVSTRSEPASVEELAELLKGATAEKKRVLIEGGGTHQGIGHRIEPDLVISTANLNRILDWEPEDLTVVIEAGVPIVDLESQLATRRQSVVLAEQPGRGTVGGALSAAISGYRRARYGPTRDRLLEVTLVTGDGRVVRGGARVVKNVTGYDLPRLAVGSFGQMGVIVSACFKLWPVPPATSTVVIDRPYGGEVHRPMAVLDCSDETRVFLGGTEPEVVDAVARLGGRATPGWSWPETPDGMWTWSLRTPPAAMASLAGSFPRPFVHQVGIGEVSFATPDTVGMPELRAAAELIGGRLVVTGRPITGEFEPWGTPPSGLALQSRLSAAFDPGRILNPGRLPGGYLMTGWVTDFAPTLAELNSCVSCGLCLPHCPTFRLTGLESASPRGRIAAMRAVTEGVLEVDDSFEEAMTFCLNCRACEAVCPSLAPFGRMMEGARAELAVQRPTPS